ncbi:hypothetical protein CDAR_470031 [Caerostris darwini]|uniref:C-type lectin domain-containing protein n=1 Tax=Caerostris darwini TaxID=1538125 RepID=A0AAV4WDK7_9ARAC|nr:hypothetical protein CDAR_470031 [Caerostris darwini]
MAMNVKKRSKRHLCNWFIVIWLQSVNCLNCPQPYVPIDSEDVCIYMSSRTVALNEMEAYCTGEVNGGKPFTRRFSDEGLKELGRNLKLTVESLFPPEVYIGMQREKNNMNQDTENFIYTNDQGTVHQDKYPLWASDPSYSDCGVVSYRKEFRVKPFSCSNSAVILCEKKELRK